MARTARQLAWRILHRVRRDGAYTNLVLSAELKRSSLSPEDRALVTELVYGVLRHQRRLDHAIGQHTVRPVTQIDADLLDLLRVAAYQLLLLDRIPAHAAVNDAVAHARRLRGPKLAGFANAVLRRLDRASLTVQRPEDPRARLALECSLPDALVQRWTEQLGPQEAAELGERLLERPPLTVRCNTVRNTIAQLRQRLAEEGAIIRSCRWSSTALRIERLAAPFETRSYREGLWTVQDEAAQLAGHALHPRPGQTVLDLCAGLGGKTTQLAAKLDGRGRLVAVDNRSRKLKMLREHCHRLGVTCETREGDLRDPLSLAGLTADRVLLDAPCSGLGLLRRHPELKWRWDPSTIGDLVPLQRALLNTAIRALRPGGVLVYSVCTTNEEEGPEQAVWVQETFAQLEPFVPIEDPLAGIFAGKATLTLWPHRHDTDGFFIARFRRKMTP